VSAQALASAAPGIRDALAWAEHEIGAASETPRLDAELLLAHALGVAREQVVIAAGDRRAPRSDERSLDRHARMRLSELVRRRAHAREPVAYLIGYRHFRRLRIAVDRRALIPRPETELLVDAALALPRGASVLDLGTGSGAVALAIKDERPDLEVAGADVSPSALALARQNGRTLGLDVDWLRADLLVGIPDRFDAIVCNPPYVADSERGTLAPEITRHEPPLALFAGPDGLDVVRATLAQLAPPARPRLRQLALEVGAGQAAAVRALMRDARFGRLRTLADLAGIERVVVGTRGSRSDA
jgi:release factor glutamine methyltransferase